MIYEVPFTIADVADLLGIPRLSGGTEDMFGAECPFCGDARGKCNFCVMRDGEIKNVFHCYHCDAGGNMLTLYADLTGIYGRDRYRQAYREIKERLAIGIRDVPQYRVRQMARIRKVEKPEPARNLSHLDAVYHEMLSTLKLKERHKADLRRRGLSEAEISAMEVLGYRSTDRESSRRIARRLLAGGFSLKGVPGFFMNRSGDWEAAFYKGNEGYLCPVRNADKEIAGFQIRLDAPYQKRKYVWFTSSGMEGGTSSKSPCSLSGKMTDGSIRVTEGILKAEIACRKSGLAYIGNPGVSNHKGLYQMLKDLKAQGLKTVYECYDMDKMMTLTCDRDYAASCRSCGWKETAEPDFVCPKKRQKRDCIRRGCLKLYEMCCDLGLHCVRITWDTDAAGIWNGVYKGIDDWLMRTELSRSQVDRLAA